MSVRTDLSVCPHALPSGESVLAAVARHLDTTPDALIALGAVRCDDLHPLARVLGGASWVAMADRLLVAETLPAPEGAPRWTLTLTYALTLLLLAATCGLLGKAVL